MSKKARARNMPCAFCGAPATTRDHIPPKALWPESSRKLSNPFTVPACAACNNGTADDDVHLRNVLAVAGVTTPQVLELWQGKITRSLNHKDGRRRAADIYRIMRPADNFSNLYKIYPAEDDRVLRSVRKVVRGLVHHLELGTALPDQDVVADVLREPLPDAIVDSMAGLRVAEGIFDFAFAIDPTGQDTLWLLRFYDRTTFLASAHLGQAGRNGHVSSSSAPP